MEDSINESEDNIQEENNSSCDEIDSEEDNEDKEKDWNNLDYKEECNFWINLKSRGFIYIPSNCQKCNSGKYEIKKLEIKNIINPFYVRCNNKKFRKRVNLRNFSFLVYLRNTPASVTFAILENFLYIGLNAQKINQILSVKYKNNLNIRKIQKILEYFRKLIFIHYKLVYNKTLIGGLDNEGQSKIVAIDESLFIHDINNEQIWVLGGIETKDKNIRLSITKIRNIDNLENFVYENFIEGTHFTHDGWNSYNFLNNNINYTHETHNHGAGDFGNGLHSTSHIENLWANLKKIITKIYGVMPQKNFILFLKEAELRYNLRNKTKDQIFNLFTLLNLFAGIGSLISLARLKEYFKEIYDYNQFYFKYDDMN